MKACTPVKAIIALIVSLTTGTLMKSFNWGDRDARSASVDVNPGVILKMPYKMPMVPRPAHTAPTMTSNMPTLYTSTRTCREFLSVQGIRQSEPLHAHPATSLDLGVGFEGERASPERARLCAVEIPTQAPARFSGACVGEIGSDYLFKCFDMLMRAFTICRLA